MGNILNTTGNQASINICNKVWDEKLSALEETLKNKISDCEKKWDVAQDAIIREVLKGAKFESDELQTLYRIHHFDDLKSFEDIPEEKTFDILKNLANNSSGNIKSWTAKRYEPNTNFNLFWWSIPIGLISWIWIPKAYIFIPVSLCFCIIRNLIRTKRCDNLLKSDKKFLEEEREKFKKLLGGIQSQIDKNKEELRNEINSISAQHQSDVNEIEQKRAAELLAIQNNETTKYAGKSLFSSNKSSSSVWKK